MCTIVSDSLMPTLTEPVTVTLCKLHESIRSRKNTVGLDLIISFINDTCGGM